MTGHLNIRNGFIKSPYLRALCQTRTDNLRIGLYRGFEPREKFYQLYIVSIFSGFTPVNKCVVPPIELTGHLLVAEV